MARSRGALLAAVLVLAGVIPPAVALPEPSATAQAPPLPVRSYATLDDLAVTVTPGANRAVSFTNHRSAFYYTQTHVNDHPEHAWFRGFNIAGRRVFNDYRITVAGQALEPAASVATIVRPDALVRRYPSGVTETLRLYDDQDVVGVEIAHARGAVALQVAGEMVQAGEAAGTFAYYTVQADPPESPAMTIAVTHAAETFLVCVASTQAAARSLCEDAARNEPRWRAERRARLERAINESQFVATDNPALTASLRWISLTTEQLLTRQRGDGIYAGLPWFQEYWGRDSFIALPGATLVTGRFEAARAILVSFAGFQDLDPTSPYYGRLPNIVKPGSVDYHTTDGTPRFVIALRDYLRYTGDAALLRQLYPNVVASIDGALARFTDPHGLLVHADNETWMDARRVSDLSAYAPRGTRANDIQALWYEQLRAGAGFAMQLGDGAAAKRWSAAAERVRSAFERLFVSRDGGQVSVADHVTAGGGADRTLRPNALFALELLPPHEAALVTARIWQDLVFPWGVATLDPGHRHFHSYHLAPGCWHKDEAYHNGTVWPWLDGAFLDQLVRFGQVEPAWQLFFARSRLALERGVVGGLPETLDAYPHPGENQPRLTGTYLQAWSNAEHLRAWYQDFLGVRPELDAERIVLNPRLPAALRNVDFTARFGAGTVRGLYERRAQGHRYRWILTGLATTVIVDLGPFKPVSFVVGDGEQLIVETATDRAHATLYSADGTQKQKRSLEVSPEGQERQREWDAVFADARFATPRPPGDLSIRCTLQ